MVRRALILVFARPVYLLASIVLGIVIALVTLLWANIPLLTLAWTSDVSSWQYAWNITWYLLWGAGESLGWWMVASIVCTATLLGILISMLHYAWRRARVAMAWRSLSTSTSGGVIAAILGLGCAACGPLLISSILALFGAAGVLILLPFEGAELSVVAIALLCYALYAVARVITRPAVCAS